MMKRILILIMILLINLGMHGQIFAQSETDIHVFVEEQEVEFNQSPIVVEDVILVSVRDICDAIGADVKWLGDKQRIEITLDERYLRMEIDSNDMVVNRERYTYLDVAPRIYNGNTFMPLRQVVEFLGYRVDLDYEHHTVMIRNTGLTSIKKLEDTQVIGTPVKAKVSSVQQFLYKDEGLAYAYIKEYDETLSLIIQTPSKKLKMDMLHSILGDVISDDAGNFYIVWGEEGTSLLDDTVFISKYSPDGLHMTTTAFKGESIMKEKGNTELPFKSGCETTIGNGVLMAHYGRRMYNGHQSSNTIGVNLSDMSPVVWKSLWHIPYTSHSFNQSIIWSERYKDFIYGDHGDAYGRGFVITRGRNKLLTFTFYLEANADYNMYIVNETFAQLGGIAETSEGIALVGASAKSVSEEAKEERQNLFLQLFNLSSDTVNKSMFMGGEIRSGATSFDINDNQNTPLTPVKDYGVRWLTNYTDQDVSGPQVVTAEDKLVILWSTDEESYYMILSSKGEILVEATSLDDRPLNSYERPIYYKGSVYWASVQDEWLEIQALEINQ